MGKREFSPDRRAELAHEDNALPDGSYPIPDCDALERAIRAYGREAPEKRAELRRLIVRRKAELGCDVPLPESWRMRKGEA